MASTINASTSPAGIIQTADGTANLSLQSNGTTIAALTSTGMAVTGTLSASGVTTFAAGTAALPAITTTGDTDTGIWFPAANTVAASTSGTERMRINSSGNVAIGSTNADPLSLTRDRNLAIVTTGTSGALTIVGGGNARVDFGVGATRTAGIYSDTANFTEIFTTTALPLVFSTNSTERMRIDSSGNLLLQKTSATLSGAGTYFEVPSSPSTMPVYIHFCKTHSGARDAIDFNHNGTRVGYIQFDNTNTSYNTSSDYRLKENIVPMTGALDTVAALKPVTYKWKVDGSDGQGFIAHELQEIVPDCVTGEKDAVETYTDEEGIEQTRIKPQGIDTSFLVATLTAAIQEQQALITSLTARITALEGA